MGVNNIELSINSITELVEKMLLDFTASDDTEGMEDCIEILGALKNIDYLQIIDVDSLKNLLQGLINLLDDIIFSSDFEEGDPELVYFVEKSIELTDYLKLLNNE